MYLNVVLAREVVEEDGEEVRGHQVRPEGIALVLDVAHAEHVHVGSAVTALDVYGDQECEHDHAHQTELEACTHDAHRH